ncbi:hypothetical protein [Photobacterium damselae]|uniref:hypothetical protein n=1 Tax=Photobacterium damselae TaxID=38293 RepID=UPI000D05B7DE|nr:hypothetical protein [Photobacterium damselae]PSB79842.1 hypothetical protein C5F62_15275 [Photobacterium damselae subsp. damselae]
MIKNQNCVYCGIAVKKSVNSDAGRSVEHLIPQIAVSKKRTNAKGDFHVCRKCNTEKSKIDELFGLISRINTPGDGGMEAISKLAKMYGKRNKAITRMIDSARNHPDGMELKLPFKGEDIYKYGVFLTKGEYFKKHLSLLDLNEKVVLVTWGSPSLVKELLSRYQSTHGSNPYDDLAKNSSVENIYEECFIVANSEGDSFSFFFNREYLLLTKIVDRNEETVREKRINKLDLIEGFSQGKASKYCT